MLLPMTLSYHWHRWNSSHTAPHSYETRLSGLYYRSRKCICTPRYLGICKDKSHNHKRYILPVPAGHFRLHGIMTERDAPSPLDKTLLHLPFAPVPAYTSPCACLLTSCCTVALRSLVALAGPSPWRQLPP